MNTVIRVVDGELLGKEYKTFSGTDFYGFLDVPYAAAPVGDLRFKPPLPSTSWVGVRDATNESRLCAQLHLSNPKEVSGDEDCLYLNVFTPSIKLNDKLLPVMVFIHGGGFIFGSKGIENRGPHYLVENGVVLVVINYRLGIFGFLNLDLPDAQGNMGLKDQVQALRWVRNNISFFNGDPSNVTIFGISAGAASVQLLCLSRMADGLFHKAIAQSGSALNHWAIGNNIKELAFSIAKSNGKEFTDTSQLLEYLKEIPAKKLASLASSAILCAGEKGGLNFEFVPSVEKIFPGQQTFLSENALELLKRGDFRKVPFMTGFCTYEGFSMLVEHKGKCKVDKLISDRDFIFFLPFTFDSKENTNIMRKLEYAYIDTKKPGEEVDKFAIDYFTDVDFLGGIYTGSKLMARHNPTIYFYEFNYDGKLNFLKTLFKIEKNGACHADETGYIFNSSIFTMDNCTENDKLVRSRMVKMWTNFAKFGNPTPQANKLLPVIWKPLTENSFQYLIINDRLTMEKDLLPKRMSIYEDLYLNRN